MKRSINVVFVTLSLILVISAIPAFAVDSFSPPYQLVSSQVYAQLVYHLLRGVQQVRDHFPQLGLFLLRGDYAPEHALQIQRGQ